VAVLFLFFLQLFISYILYLANSCFASVPISNSEESYLLRIAHAQRGISGFLCDTVWPLFASEYAVQNPEVIETLAAISPQVAKSNHGKGAGGRAEIVWAAPTMRALQSLEPTSPSERNSTQISQSQVAPTKLHLRFSAV
jgi:hypothetical protein